MSSQVERLDPVKRELDCRRQLGNRGPARWGRFHQSSAISKLADDFVEPADARSVDRPGQAIELTDQLRRRTRS